MKNCFVLAVLVFVMMGCVGQESVAVPTASLTVIQTATATAPASEKATSTASLVATPRATATTEPVHLRPTLVLRSDTGPVTRLAWSPDGKLLASASGGFEAFQSDDLAIRLWAADGTLRETLMGHTKTVSALAWSPDGQTLASSSYDGTAKLWNTSGELKKSLGGTESLHNVAWSPDGQTLATGGIIGGVASITTAAACCVTLPGVVRLWRPDGALMMTLGTQFTGGKFLNLGWSPDGLMLAAGATDYRIWRSDGTLLGSTPGCNSCTPAWGMAWSPDSKTLATGNENGELYLYDTKGNRTGSFRYASGINEIHFSPNDVLLAIGSTMHSVQLLRAGDLQSLGVLTTPARPPVRWSPDGTLLATGNITSLARVFRSSGEEIMTLDGCAGVVRALAWSRDGRTLAAGTDANLVCLWAIPSS